MKLWKWETFVISFIVAFGLLLLLFQGILRIELWTPVLLLSLLLSVGITAIKGLRKRIHDLEYRAELLEARVWELEKKTEKE